VCYPPSNPKARQPPMIWAQLMILGHTAIALGAYQRRWPVLASVLISLGPFWNGWLFFLCNSTQHTGMQHGGKSPANIGAGKTEHVDDFRLTTRSFYLNSAVLRCWYWSMNYHIEHHMWPQVPCYRLGELHEVKNI